MLRITTTVLVIWMCLWGALGTVWAGDGDEYLTEDIWAIFSQSFDFGEITVWERDDGSFVVLVKSWKNQYQMKAWEGAPSIQQNIKVVDVTPADGP